VFQQWIRENTSGVVLIHIRDRETGGWENPYESTNITEIATKPMLLLEYNWFKMQEYSQNDLMGLAQSMMGNYFNSLCFQYIPEKNNARAALNFHLTKSEKKDIANALKSERNQQLFTRFNQLIKNSQSLTVR
jgi:hypothetical protein